MKKHIECEKQTEAGRKEIKGTLLRTYFISLLSLVLCVAMFLGTSYAWFTSEVNNASNEIYIGTLDVGLYKVKGAQEQDLADNNNKLFDSNIRWEPGYTALETVKIVNEGDLAFKYVLNFTDGTITEGSDLKTVAQHFCVWVYRHSTDAATTAPASYDELTAPDSGWVNAGTLDQLLSGKGVLTDVMEAVRDQDAATPANDGTTDGVDTEHTYTIALHMNEETGDVALMGKVIRLSLKLVAYQMTYEEDSMGSQYDTMAATAQELEAAFANGGKIALAADISLEEALTVPKDVAVTLDMNGHAIRMAATEAGNMITNNGTLTLTDSAAGGELAITFDGVVNSGAVNTVGNRGVLTVNGVKITNTATVTNQIGYAIDNHNGACLTVNSGEITASGSNYYDAIRLFCGDKETVVTVNGGKISSVWAQNTTADKASEVKGTVIINGGDITTTYYENFTTVKVAEDVSATVLPYGNGKDHTTTTVEDGYTVYSFVQNP